jgi:hypothetical protein
MSGLTVGDPFPEGVTFTYVAPTGELDLTACGLPIQYDASKGKYLPVPVPQLPDQTKADHP